MSAVESPPTNLKERIAALQQRNGSPSPSPSPTSTPHDASLTPPRSSLRDKIAKFERKGGVPVPRGSFGLGAPPPEDAGSTKSREMYGNRVAALGKGRPTAPGNSGTRAVTSPAATSTTPTSRDSPDDDASNPAVELMPNSINNSTSPETPPPLRRDSSPLTDRTVGVLSANDASDEAQATSVQLAAGAQPESLTEIQEDAKFSEPSQTITKSTAPNGHHPPSVSQSSSSTGLAVTTLAPGNTSSTSLRTTSSRRTSTQAGSPIIPKASPTTDETNIQEPRPAATPKSDVSPVQPSIAVEQVPVEEITISAHSRGIRPDRPPQNGTRAISSSVTQLPSSSIVSPTDNLKVSSTSITSDVPVPNKTKINILPSSGSTPASSIILPSKMSSKVRPVSEDSDELTAMSLPPITEPGRRSFASVVHRSDSENGSEPRLSTTSRSSTITPRPSTSSFKTGADGGVVRSKRNFKHLGTVAVDSPPSPGLGELGSGDLAALLQDAAWLEQQLYDENETVPSALGEDENKAEDSAPSPAKAASKAGQATTPAPTVATSTRSKGRGLTLASLTSAPSNYSSQSPIRSSPSTPSFQVHPDTSPTQPKSGRGRKYFSLRSALRGPRLSMSSEMSSDDSAPVATPPSPSFDLQGTQGHGTDSMSIRSMFSIRSNKSGKSDSAPGSMRLSPRRGVARASSFAERLLNRASKAKSMLDDPDDAIQARSPILPPIIPETPGSLLTIVPALPSPNRDLFDAFPDVPSEIPQRPASYLFPASQKTAAPVEQTFRHSSTIGVTTSQNGSPSWLR